MDIPVSGSVTVAEAVVPSLLRTRYRREARQPDDEEEMWFNDDDELEDDAPLDAAQPHAHAHPLPHPHHALDAIGNVTVILLLTCCYVWNCLGGLVVSMYGCRC